MNNLPIQENQLELIVSEKTLGSLTTNAIQIREIVKNSLSRYDISNYGDDNISDAKADKAMLNKASKALNAKRLEIEKEFLKPFAEFKEIVNETVKLISDCYAKIDIIVKQNEAQEKEQKRKVITDYFNTLNFNIIPLNKIFKDEWLNKTAKEKIIFEEICNKVGQIKTDLIVIDGLIDSTALRTFYFDCLSLTSTIQYANKLKEEREKTKEIEKQPTLVLSSPQVEEMLTRSFKVITTRENIVALGNFMNERGIQFQKI